ncbi:hypothetical protein CP533_2363 [Ophiocordyceps camponoti-saundersi (nom. inval.)]|nr:hypothetical protein CP533_2363 [Ophiocordyceps camponoti-saundersi (nom. inval.)]
MRPCDCRACNSALRGTGRRVTTAARRRKPSFAEILTACYSTVILSATCADAFRKDRRRAEIDQQLDAARQALADLQNEATTEQFDPIPQETPRSDIEKEQMVPIWRALKNVYRERSYLKDMPISHPVDGWKLVRDAKAQVYDCPDQEELNKRQEIDYEALERAARIEEENPSIRVRQPQTEAHRHRELLSVEKLICQLLCRTKQLEISSRHSPWLRDAIERMLNASSTEYSLPAIDGPRNQRNTMLLIKHIRDIMVSDETSLRQKMGKICYNLLVSAYAPNILVYNALIIAFSRTRLNTLAEVLIWSFFHYRVIQPTPVTYIAILNHYNATSDLEEFLNIIARISGCDGKLGGKVARRHITECRRGGSLGKWRVNDGQRTRIGEWVFEHVPLTRSMVNEIMRSLVRFKLFRQAVYLYITCMACQVVFRAAVIRDLLDECVSALDWTAALELIRGLITHNRSWKAFMMTGDFGTDWYLINRIYTLLDICGLRSGPKQVSEQYLDALGISPASLGGLLADLDLHQQWLRRPCFPLSAEGEPSAVRSRSRLLQIYGLMREVAIVENTTRSLESTLLYPDSNFSLEFRLPMARHIAEQALQDSLQLMDDSGEILRRTVGFGPWLVPLSSDRRINAKDEHARKNRIKDEYLARALRAETPAELENLRKESVGSAEAETMVAEMNMALSLRTARLKPKGSALGTTGSAEDDTREFLATMRSLSGHKADGTPVPWLSWTDKTTEVTAHDEVREPSWEPPMAAPSARDRDMDMETDATAQRMLQDGITASLLTNRRLSMTAQATTRCKPIISLPKSQRSYKGVTAEATAQGMLTVALRRCKKSSKQEASWPAVAQPPSQGATAQPTALGSWTDLISTQKRSLGHMTMGSSVAQPQAGGITA